MLLSNLSCTLNNISITNDTRIIENLYVTTQRLANPTPSLSLSSSLSPIVSWFPPRSLSLSFSLALKPIDSALAVQLSPIIGCARFRSHSIFSLSS
ncbi:unnamed protein product [Citrullus colocynthis]|uniref:Uncharacterized protein n=1 Tax=Citrullus colocynthis TaxID=252529 RepID=A0ABP0XXY6_9ROSI